MTGGGDDIQGYLNIIEGKFPDNKESATDTSVDFGVATAGAVPGNMYIFDNGLRWTKILQEDEDYWQIEHGFLEYNADSVEYISKYDMTEMIRSGDMVLTENREEKSEILEESLSLDDGPEFDIFMEKVERYLFINEDRDVDEYDYDWNSAWSDGKTPVDAAEEAILLEV